MLRECDNCGMEEERVFTDTWTGRDICLTCLSECAGQITNSPSTDDDNLADVLPSHERSRRA